MCVYHCMLSAHCFLSCFCTSKELHLREPCGAHPCWEMGLWLSPEAEPVIGKWLGLGLQTDSRFHQQTQAAVDSLKLQAEFPSAAQLSHSRVIPHRGAKTSSIKHLLPNPIVELWEPAVVSGGQSWQSRSWEALSDHPGACLSSWAAKLSDVS